MDPIDVKWIKKNPRTKSYIWTARVLQEGHEDFCEMWSTKACAQLVDSEGNTSFIPVVPNCDPDLTVHEDVDHLLLNADSGSQNAWKKLELPCSTTVGREIAANSINMDGDENNPVCAPFVLLDPQDVSKTFSDMQNISDGPNCSAIATNNNENEVLNFKL